MVKQNKSFFHKRSTITSFGIAALLFGFYFMNTGFGLNIFTRRVTGNFVANDAYSIFGATSLIGMLLIVCAAILIIYAIVKKE